MDRKLYKHLGVFHSSKYDYPNPTNINPNNKSSEVKAKVPNKLFFENSNFFVYENTNLTKNNNTTYFKKGRKIVTEYLLHQINELGILLWYLDDGSLSVKRRFKQRKNSINYWTARHATISTMSFTKNENELIKEVFADRFNIDLKIYFQKSKNPGTNKLNGNIHPYIYMNPENFRKFFDLLRPWLYYIPKSMKYKFNMNYQEKEKNYNHFKKYNL